MKSRKKLVGGRLCLDFVNTMSWRGRERPVENLETFGDLLSWCVHAGILSAAETKLCKARRLDDVRELREAIYRLLLAWAENRRPRPPDVQVLNDSIPSRTHLRWKSGAFEWKTALGRILGPVAWSAADLLVHGDSRRLRRCGSRECGWLFYDESVNGLRRWCSMSDCGNREKARRHYARSIAAS